MAARRLLLTGVAALLALGGVVGLPRVASAHALRTASSPSADSVLASPPSQVSVTFGERPDPAQSTIQVLDSAGHDHASGPARPAASDDRTLMVPVGTLADGVYTVAWRTLSAVDGHRAAGSFAFGVGVSGGQVAAVGGGGGRTSVTDTSPPPSALAVAGRWVLYVGLIAVLGASLVGGLVLASVSTAVLVQARAGAAAAVAGTGMVLVAQGRDAGLGFAVLVHSALGGAVIERLLGVASAVVAVSLVAALRGTARRVVLLLAGAASALAMLADVGNSHAAAGGSWVWSNVLLQWVHIGAVGFWIGGLAALLLAIRGNPSPSRAAAVRRFSFGAGIALAAVVITGVVRAAVEIGGWGNVLSTTFGRIVVAKIGLIAVLAILGGINRRRNVTRAARVVRGLRRIGSAELAVAAGAVFAAALLVNVAPPVSAQASSASTAAPAPLTLTASDYATTVRVSLSVLPAAAGFNTFSVRVLGYDSGTAAPGVTGVQLDFQLIERPDVGASTLTLNRAADATWTGRGGNLSLDGVWAVTALVERGAQSADVHFTVPTRTAQTVDVSSAPGQPTLYTVHIGGGRTAQWYLDPQKPGADEVHVSFFDASGSGYAAANGVITMLPAGGSLSTLPTRQLEPGHFVGDATVQSGKYRFDVLATGPDGSPLTAHVDISIGS